ncbi:unnamed protein product [Caenorhabditis auriculariae]|uniref:Uncharacterized protein n=1 Tax=Caenorhabditis auriculariae TaxID=2777116 RepID=A0A8S1H8Q2_9PELO|nr:unnamed protein product [Caenorhabditis auriculariae]
MVGTQGDCGAKPQPKSAVVASLFPKKLFDQPTEIRADGSERTLCVCVPQLPPAVVSPEKVVVGVQHQHQQDLLKVESLLICFRLNSLKAYRTGKP